MCDGMFWNQLAFLFLWLWGVMTHLHFFFQLSIFNMGGLHCQISKEKKRKEFTFQDRMKVIERSEKTYVIRLFRVRPGCQGVVSWTCDPVLALGQRFDSNSAAIPCGKEFYCTLPSLLGWDLKQEVPCLCTHKKSHLTVRKRVGLCGRWWWMTVHQYTRNTVIVKWQSVSRGNQKTSAIFVWFSNTDGSC